MSSVPYTFSTATGNIALSELDANFANVKASVDTANIANTALTAVTVTSSSQPNITSVGTLTAISVTGNAVAGNLYTAGVLSAAGNVRGGNVNTIGLVTAAGNITGGNLIAVGTISSAGNINSGNILVNGIVSVNGGVTAGNVLTSGSVRNTGLEVVGPNYINITANAQSGNLSTVSSTNFLVANNTGYTFTVNMPAGPIDGQITRFTVAGNTVTLVAGTGNLNSSFAGSTTVGSGYKYTYRASTTTWYKSI